MNNIFISGAHGSGCSLIKSLATSSKIIDYKYGTCHESWTSDFTMNRDRIIFNHQPSYKTIKEIWNPDIIIWLHVNKKNITRLCRRIVILDFLYTNDHNWVENDWCWTKKKHDTLAGPDWPAYSTILSNYPQWCLDEMCQVAYDRSKPWMMVSKHATYVIDSDELFGPAPPTTLSNTLKSLNCTVDTNFLSQWKIKNNKVYEEYKNLFSWTPTWCLPNGWPTVDITEDLHE